MSAAIPWELAPQDSNRTTVLILDARGRAIVVVPVGLVCPSITEARALALLIADAVNAQARAA